MRRLQGIVPETTGSLEIVYRELLNHNGPQHWWPAEEPFEVMVGAVLTQSAAWVNVEKAIGNLKRSGVLDPRRIREMPLEGLALLIYSSGYYNAKASKLKALARYLGDRYGDSLAEMLGRDTRELRAELLQVHGIGEETADSILLYACEKPVFVVDAYTRRVFSRIGLCSDRDTYREIQALFIQRLPPVVPMFNEYHALIVQHGKDICRKRPLCRRCCLLGLCSYGQQAAFQDDL